MNILIVDDNRTNLIFMSRLVEQVEGCKPLAFDDPIAALAHVAVNGCDVALVDYLMPKLDGVSFIGELRKLPRTADIPVVMITAEGERELRHLALDIGATSFMQKPIDSSEFKTRLRNLVALRRAHEVERSRADLLAEEVANATRLIADREQEIILRLARATELRDGGTGAHIERIAHYSRMIAEAIGVSRSGIRDLFLASPMHDIGKLSVPDSILLKPGPLTGDERGIMERHTVDGFHLLDKSPVALLEVAAEIALTHHERFDGTGYPNRKLGNEIPLFGRIVAVADVFDALTTERPYKRAWTADEALAHMIEQRGKHFDPACLDAFIARWPDVLEFKKQSENDAAIAA